MLKLAGLEVQNSPFSSGRFELRFQGADLHNAPAVWSVVDVPATLVSSHPSCDEPPTSLPACLVTQASAKPYEPKGFQKLTSPKEVSKAE